MFGSLLAEYPENKEIKNLSEVVLYNIALFMIEELEYMENMKKLEIEREEELLDPSDRDSTELGEVPQEAEKGALRPGWIRGPYGMNYMYRF